MKKTSVEVQGYEKYNVPSKQKEGPSSSKVHMEWISQLEKLVAMESGGILGSKEVLMGANKSSVTQLLADFSEVLQDIDEAIHGNIEFQIQMKTIWR